MCGPQGNLRSGVVEVVNSTFYGNFGADFGGAIYMESAGVALLDVLMDSNSCEPVRGLGGALASK